MKGHHIAMASRLLGPGETVLAAIPCGNVKVRAGGDQNFGRRDHLILTDKRIIEIKGAFFTDGSGVTAYPRKMCTKARAKPFAMGTTLKIVLNDPRKPDWEKELEFEGVKRADAEVIVNELNSGSMPKVLKCPRCSKIMEKEHTFCPGCGTPLKKLCPKCGKPMPVPDTPCPRCG